MTRFLFRITVVAAFVCLIIVLFALGIGRILPPEDEIAFSANIDGNDFEIYRMSLVRRISIPLTDNTDDDMNPAWSPDGEQIIFSNEYEYFFTLYQMSANGGERIRVTEPVNISPVWSPNEGDAVWSPNGRYIAYVTNQYNDSNDIFLIDLRLGITKRLTYGDRGENSPTWSPDSHYLAFSSDMNQHGNADVFTVDIQTGKIEIVVSTPEWEGNPAWSPNGRYILYTNLDAPSSKIYLWDTIKLQSALLFEQPNLVYAAFDWSPDSRYIIYSGYTGMKNFAIFQIDVIQCLNQLRDCTPLILTPANARYVYPHWRPTQP